MKIHYLHENPGNDAIQFLANAEIVPTSAKHRTIDPAVVRFGMAVRGLRSEHRMSLRDLSERTGIAFSHLSQIERGRKDVSLGYAFRIARAFDLPLSWFVGEET